MDHEDCGSWKKPTGRVQEAETDGTADTLGQEELVILGCQGCHHESENVQEGADYNERRRAILVKQVADGRPEEEEEEDLERWDPGNGAAVVGAERTELIVALEDADACKRS
jgi:hypothetical protein